MKEYLNAQNKMNESILKMCSVQMNYIAFLNPISAGPKTEKKKLRQKTCQKRGNIPI